VKGWKDHHHSKTKSKHTLDFFVEKLGCDIIVAISKLNPRVVATICDYNS
jgi:hypothetical protein